MRSTGLSKAEALSFLLTHIVVEQEYKFEMSQINLFKLMNLASEAESNLKQEEGLIPHEVIEVIAKQFIEQDL